MQYAIYYNIFSHFNYEAYKFALADFAQAIVVQSTKPELFFFRGCCLCKVGRYEQVARLLHLLHSFDVLSLHVFDYSVTATVFNVNTMLVYCLPLSCRQCQTI